MPTLTPTLTYVICVVTGAVLFFFAFAAVFAGVWSMLLLSFTMYGVASALATQLGRVQARSAALALVVPGLPWALWLFGASIREAGMLRASLWLAAIVVMFLLAWVGGALGARRAVRRA